ncbi:hypothetical protein Tco_0478543 [Tanacetum coccineum]
MNVGMDQLSKRKFAKVCHEKVVRIPLEGDEILRVHGERNQGVMKTLKNAKVDELKLMDDALKERMKPIRVRAVAMTIQYEVRGMILAVQSEVFKQENVKAAISKTSGLLQQPEILKSHILWVEIRESSLTGLELVQETTDKVVLIKEKLKAVRDRPKELCWIGLVADRLRLPEELSCIKVYKTLCFVKELVENSDREVKRDHWEFLVKVGYIRFLVDLSMPLDVLFLFDELRDRVINDVVTQLKAKLLAVRHLVKVSWNTKCNFELTWVERISKKRTKNKAKTTKPNSE